MVRGIFEKINRQVGRKKHRRCALARSLALERWHGSLTLSKVREVNAARAKTRKERERERKRRGSRKGELVERAIRGFEAELYTFDVNAADGVLTRRAA